MPQTYEVKVVTPKEWARVVAGNPRYVNADEDTLGFADPERRVGYVRNTHVGLLNKYLLAHEFDHLLEEEGTEEDEHGIRFKKGSDVFRNIAAVSLAPFTGGLSLAAGSEKFRGQAQDIVPKEAASILPTLGAGVSGEPLGRAVKQAAPSLIGGTLALTGIPGLIPGIATSGAGAGAAAGAAKAATGAPQALQATRPGIPAGFSLRTPASFGAPTPGGLSAPASRLAGGISQFRIPTELPSLTSQFQQLGGTGSPLGSLGGGGGGGGAGGGGGGGFGAVLDKAKGLLGKAAGGAAGAFGANLITGAGQGGQQPPIEPGSLLAAGGLLAAGEARGTPSLPQFSALPSVQAIQQTAGQGQAVSPVGTAALQRVQEQLGQEFQGLPEEEVSRIRAPFREQQRLTERNLKAFQPGFNLTDPEYLRQIDPILRAESQEIGLQERLGRERFDTLRRQDIQTALGVDDRTLETMFSLAQLDVDQISLQTGMDFQAARDFKETFARLAELFTVRGLGLNSFRVGLPPGGP